MRLLGGLVGYLASSLESILDTRLDYMRGFVGILSGWVRACLRHRSGRVVHDPSPSSRRWERSRATPATAGISFSSSCSGRV